MLGRVVHRADFERLLASPPRWRSAHFAIHHVAQRDLASPESPSSPEPVELSTELLKKRPLAVENSSPKVSLGVLVPKRHARRAVTRNLIRRLVRAMFSLHTAALPAGQWLVRQKAPFAPARFVSAASPALASAVRQELERLLGNVVGARPAQALSA